MGNQKLRAKDLRRIDFSKDKLKSMALTLMNKHFKHQTIAEKIDLLIKIKENPEAYETDKIIGKLAAELIDKKKTQLFKTHDLKANKKDYSIYGSGQICAKTKEQMDLAMRLPISKFGVLMLDAHLGYGLPIGGVLSTDNAVIPYGVGMDIGCRMCLTVYDVPYEYLNRNDYLFKKILRENTFFGTGVDSKYKGEHEVLDSRQFSETDLLSKLHGKAVNQLGTSGSGNHFVEFGKVILPETNSVGMHAGEYIGILTHSGSRGLGATIAKHYTNLAKELCKLPNQAQHLAWLDLNSAEGQEYWLSMTLAGDFAQACHDVIHHRLAKAIGLQPVITIQNFHNFAWKEMVNGEELIVHRKGATPASKDELGIIPGSMTAPGYIVRGKGNEQALNSASHGAGRRLSRTKTKSTYTASEMKKDLKRAGVSLIGGGVDEAPIAYKNIEKVIESQKDLITIEGMFYPRIVRMDK